MLVHGYIISIDTYHTVGYLITTGCSHEPALLVLAVMCLDFSV